MFYYSDSMKNQICKCSGWGYASGSMQTEAHSQADAQSSPVRFTGCRVNLSTSLVANVSRALCLYKVHWANLIIPMQFSSEFVSINFEQKQRQSSELAVHPWIGIDLRGCTARQCILQSTALHSTDIGCIVAN